MHVVDVIRSVVHIILLVINLCVSDSVRQKNGDPFHAQFVAPQFANDVLDPCEDAPHSHTDRAWLAGWIGSTRYSRYMYAELDWWLRSRNWQAFLLNDCLPEWFGKSTLDWLNDGPLITIIIIYLGILHHQFISFITGHILQYVTWRLEIELTSISNIFYHCRCPSGCVFCLFVDPNYDWSPTFHSDDANTLNVTQVSYVFLSMTDSFFITINIIIPFWFVNNPFIDRGPSVRPSRSRRRWANDNPLALEDLLRHRTTHSDPSEHTSLDNNWWTNGPCQRSTPLCCPFLYTTRVTRNPSPSARWLMIHRGAHGKHSLLVP